MAFNDIPADLREAIRENLDLSTHREYAAALFLESVDDETDYCKNLGGVMTEIMDETPLEFYVDDGEIVIDQNRVE